MSGVLAVCERCKVRNKRMPDGSIFTGQLATPQDAVTAAVAVKCCYFLPFVSRNACCLLLLLLSFKCCCI